MKSHDIDRLLAEQSSQFIEVVKRNEPRELAKFIDWLRESRRHVRHMLMMVALDQELRHIDPERKWRIEPDTIRSSSDVVGLSSRRQRSQAAHAVAHRLRWPLAAAFAAGILVAVGFYWIPRAGAHAFATGIGEQRTIELEEGSVVHLNAQSRLDVRFSKHGRDLRLLTGEALFEVRRDASRPFRVQTSDAVIQAVGTAFNVYRRSDGTTVSVLEGRVRVSSDPAALRESTSAAAPVDAPMPTQHKAASLSAGEQARVGEAGEIATARVADADLADVTAWRQRRIVFRRSSLAQVVAEFNRYNRTAQFRMVGDVAGARRYSGIFDADEPESLIDLLGSEPDLSLERDGNVILIHERIPTGVAKRH